MKKIIFYLFIQLFIAGSISAQGNFTITGSVMTSNGNPVANQQVCIFTDTMQTSLVYFNCLNTGSQGQFSVVIPGGSAIGPNIVFYLSMYSSACNTSYQLQVQNNQGTTSGATVNFLVCANSVSNCTTTLNAIPDSSGISGSYYFYGSANQGGPAFNTVSYSWTFGDGSSSTLAAPYHTYANPGTYTVCLTTQTSSGCTSSACNTVTVSNNAGNCTAQFGFQTSGAGNNTYFNANYGSNYNYSWNFGDGSFGTGQFPVHVYQSPGNYSVCLTVYSFLLGCSDTICKLVTISTNPSGNNNISGKVSLPGMGMLNNADYATVYLIKQDSLLLTAVDTTDLDSAGYYHFNGIVSGTYLVKAALDSNSAYYSYFMPTYHSSSLFWVGANAVQLINANAVANITMIPGANPGGPGFIGGSVLQGANRMASPGDPIVGVSILLLNMNNSPVASTFTDINGNYSFAGIAFGTYKVYAELAGRSTTPSIVTINSTTPSISNVNVEVNSSTILGIATSNATKATFVIFPSPAKEELSIMTNSITAGNTTIEIYNNLGVLVKTERVKMQIGNNKFNISLDGMSAGSYSVSLTQNSNKSTIRFIKIN